MPNTVWENVKLDVVTRLFIRRLLSSLLHTLWPDDICRRAACGHIAHKVDRHNGKRFERKKLTNTSF